jgi:hypothetical protein
MKMSAVSRVAILAVALIGSASPQVPSPSAAPPSPRSAAAIDLTGYWVSIVNEDWRWRMLTPPKGDYASVPLNPAGKKMADAWNPAEDGSCKSYGVGGVMRMPTRVHIVWESDSVLQIETDWGEQTRHLYFNSTELPATGVKDLQGSSLASWEHPTKLIGGMGFGGGGPPLPGGALKVVTINMLPGWLRRNGVPYSENATVTEYFDRFATPDGNEWFVVTTIVDDPAYLLRPFVTSSHFRREPDASKWTPRPCKH